VTPGQATASADKEPPRTVTSLDDIVNILKNPNAKHTEVFRALNALRVTPVDPSRRAEVGALLDPLVLTPDSTFQSQALEVMPSWGSEQNIPMLIKALAIPDSYKRSRVIDAMGAIGGKEAAVALVEQLQHDREHRGSITTALSKIGPVAEPLVWPLVGSRDLDMNAAACNVLGKVGNNKTLARLKAMAKQSKAKGGNALDSAIRELERRLVKR
jgi:HEAT repeat protein